MDKTCDCNDDDRTCKTCKHSGKSSMRCLQLTISEDNVLLRNNRGRGSWGDPHPVTHFDFGCNLWERIEGPFTVSGVHIYFKHCEKSPLDTDKFVQWLNKLWHDHDSNC